MTRKEAEGKLAEYEHVETSVVEMYLEAETAGDLDEDQQTVYLARIGKAEVQIYRFKKEHGFLKFSTK